MVLKIHKHIPHEKLVDPYFCHGQVMPIFLLTCMFCCIFFGKSCVQNISKRIKASTFKFGILIGTKQKITTISFKFHDFLQTFGEMTEC